jgi:mannose-6-phosphate isomerase-like protein (cupin superfamily)
MSQLSGVTMQWLMEDAIDPRAGVSLARMTVVPRVTSPAHRHPDCSETVHVVAGRIEQRRGDEWLPLAAGETLLIPPGAVHQTRSLGPEEAVLMVAYSSGARVYLPEP